MRMNYAAIVVAAVAALVAGSLWYSPLLFGHQWMALRGMDPGALADAGVSQGKLVVEFVRSLVVACVLARFVAAPAIVDWRAALSLGAWVWIGFPAMILVGSVTWEDVPWTLAAIHAGDWLAKLLIMAVILGVWRTRASAFMRDSSSGIPTSPLRPAG